MKVFLCLAVIAASLAGEAVSAQNLEGIDPSELDPSGGAAVTITGARFERGVYVTIGTKRLVNPVIVDATTITGTAPANDPGSYDLTLFSASDQRLDRIADAVTYVTPPDPVTIRSIEPRELDLAGGTTVTIRGTGFAAGQYVTIGAKRLLDLEIVDAMTIEGTAPAGDEPGLPGVTIFSDLNTRLAFAPDLVEYVAPPPVVAIRRVEPEELDSRGGEIVTIIGEGFERQHTFYFEGRLLTAQDLESEQRATGTAPALPPGDYVVEVRDGDEVVATLADGVRYVDRSAEPEITRIHPQEHWTSGGTFIAIDGRNFTEDLTVEIGGVPLVDAEPVGPTRIVGKVPPAAAAGWTPVTLERGFTATLDTWEQGVLYRDLELEIVGVIPSELPTSGGDVVLVFKESIDPEVAYEVYDFPGEYAMRFDGVDRASVTLPPREPGTYDLRVGTRDRGATTTRAQAVTYVTPSLPPVQDLNCEFLGDKIGAVISWSHVIEAEGVRVYCDGELMAELPGDATELGLSAEEWGRIADGTTDHFFTVEIFQGRLGAANPSVTCAIGGFTDCPSPVPTGGTGFASDELLPLPGGDTVEWRAYFSLDEDASNGVRVRVHGSRYRTGGDLKARLREIQPPYDVLIDNIDVNNLPVSMYSRWTEAIFPVPLPEGEYVLGFYVDGGNENLDVYGLTKDAAVQQVAPPYPCPPYPLIEVLPLSGNIPPVIHDIRRVTLAPGVEDLLLGDLQFGVGGRKGAGGGNAGDKVTLTLAVDAEDPDGFITEYFWDFGDGTAISAGSTITHSFEKGKIAQAKVVVKDNACGSATEFEAFGTGAPPPATDELIAIVPPRIFGIHPPPDEKRYIPDIAPDVEVTFYTQVAPSNFGEITEVRFEIIHVSNDAQIYLSETAAMFDGSPALSWWKATLNMSDVPNVTEARIRVHVEDSDDKEASDVWPMGFCPKPAYLDLPLISTDISYQSGSHRYIVEGSFPGQLLWEHDFEIPLPGPDLVLENHAEARATARMRLEDEKWFADEVKAVLALELFNFTVLDKQWSVSPNSEIPGQVFFECPDFDIVYEVDDIQLLDKDFDWTIFYGPLVSGKIIGVDLELWGYLGIQLGAAIYNDLMVRLSRNQPHFQFEYVFEPELSLGVTGGIDLVVANGIGSVGATINPSVGFALPITMDWDGSDFDTSVGFCLGLDIDAEVHACALWGVFCVDHTFNVYDNEWGSGCGGAGGIGVDPTVPQQMFPSVATSPSGNRTLMIFMKDVDTDPGVYDPELYFAEDTGGGWSVPAPVFPPTDRLRRDSSLAFVSDTQAVAVWTENTLPIADVVSLTQVLSDTEATAEIFRNEEIFFSVWTEGSGWADAEMLTADQIPDGRPKVAAAPGAGEAWCTWTRSMDGDLFAENGLILRDKLEVVARRIAIGGPPGPIEQLSAPVAGEPVADYEPAIAVSPSGNTVCVVWVQDGDGFMGTSADRVIAYSFRTGDAWTPVETLDFGLTGLEMPTIALSSDDDGMLAFTADQPLVNTNEGPSLANGVGNLKIVYTAQLSNGLFGNAYPLQRGTCPPGTGAQVLAVFPVIVWDEVDESFGLVARTFNPGDPPGDTIPGSVAAPVGTSGPLTLDGDALVATFYPSEGVDAAWYVKDLARDGERDWEPAIATGREGDLCVVNSTKLDRAAPEGAVDRGVRSYFVSLEPEIVVDRFAVSDRHASPGEQATVMVDLRNAGLAPVEDPLEMNVSMIPASDSPHNVWVDAVNMTPPVFSPGAHVARAIGSYAVHSSSQLELTLGGTARKWKKRAKGVDDATLSLPLGVQPPRDVACEETQKDGQRIVTLTWQNGEAYDAIHLSRNGHLVEILDGQATLYQDRVSPSAAPGDYELRAFVGEAKSASGIATCSTQPPGSGAMRPFDCNADGTVNIADPICLLGFLFGGAPDVLPCGDGEAADAPNGTLMDWNGDGGINIADAIAGLLHLFSDGSEPRLGSLTSCVAIEGCPVRCE